MRDHVYRFDFEPGAPLGEIRRSLQLAALSAEILHGPEAVRLEGARRFDKQARRCIIDGHGGAGRDLARPFTGFLTRQFGARSFRVIRLDGSFQERLRERYSDEQMFHRELLYVGREQIDTLRGELWELTKSFLEARRRGVFYQNTSFCFQYGRPCPYFALCRSGGNPNIIENFYRREAPHTELAEEPEADPSIF